MIRRRFALVAGGGTGGHILPALAVARALASTHGTEAVELVGSSRGLDSELVRGSGLAVTLLPGRGLSRRMSAKALWQNTISVGQILVAGIMALVLVLRRRPSVVVAMGGYACVAVSLAAAALRVPVVLVNVDAVPGAANRVVGRFARACAVAFEGTPLPRAVVTGAPVREEVVATAAPTWERRYEARTALGIPPGRSVVGVVGGSLGAKRLNETVIALARIWRERSDLALYHVVGRRDSEWASALAAEVSSGSLWYVQVPFEEHMEHFYACADAVVCRAGANTIAELTVVGVPAVVVPLPGSPADHQLRNAEVLGRAGAAIVLEDEALTPERLGFELDRILSDESSGEKMRLASRELGRPHALQSVVSVVESEARHSR